MTDKIIAPWSDREVLILNRVQGNPLFHGYTCGTDSTHSLLIATISGWHCPDCVYVQNWALNPIGNVWPPNCDMHGGQLTEAGALMFGPPAADTRPECKLHICWVCWKLIMGEPVLIPADFPNTNLAEPLVHALAYRFGPNWKDELHGGR